MADNCVLMFQATLVVMNPLPTAKALITAAAMGATAATVATVVVMITTKAMGQATSRRNSATLGTAQS